MKEKLEPLALAALLALPGAAAASGFALIESNANGQGGAYAGAAAVAEDASTIFFNPAGMTRLPGRQITASVHAIDFHTRFDDGNPATHDGGDAGGLAIVPNLYYAMPLAKDVWFGLGVNVPFGLKTGYDPAWSHNTKAIRSGMTTLHVNPSLAVRVTERLSLGIGFNLMYIEADLTKSLTGSPALTAQVTGNDWSHGFNAGLLYEWETGTRIGVAYRSKVRHSLEGNATFTALVPNGPVTADVTLPDSLSLSVYHPLSPRLALLADVTWTGWSVFDELRIVRTDGTPLETTYERWKDTYRYTLGVHYRLNERIKLRAGIGFDESPIPDAQHRTARVPDSDRTWVAFGVGYHVSPSDTLDIAYSHLFVKDAPIDFTNERTTTPIRGAYRGYVDILGVQYTHTF